MNLFSASSTTEARQLPRGVLALITGSLAGLTLVRALLTSQWGFALASLVSLVAVGVCFSGVFKWPMARVVAVSSSLTVATLVVSGLVSGGVGPLEYTIAALLACVAGVLFGQRGAVLAAGLAMVSLAAGASWPLAVVVLAAAAGAFIHRGMARVTRALEAQQLDLARTAALLETEVKLRTHAQKELNRAYHAALEGTRLKTAFLANMSHELRTPMNAVVALTDLMLRDELAPAHRDNLETVRESSQGLLVLLDDLLDLSKIEAGAMRLEVHDFSPRDVLTQLERLLGARAKHKGIGLSLTMTDAVPRVLRGDALRLTQVMTNLVGNAIKFTEHGAVTVLLDWVAPTLRVEVTDTGVGMTAEQMQGLFQPFMQGDASTTRRFGGTGLGLAIVQRLCAMHDGKVTVTSQPEVGSVFTALLNFQIGELLRPMTSGSGARPVQSLEGLRVLVAEDNAINQRVAQRLLERLGVQPVMCGNGREAVDLMSAATFDVILMDIQMPEMDGVEATRHIRRLASAQPVIIALSANAMEEDRRLASDAGVDDFLSKPITLDSLAEALMRSKQRTARLLASA